MVVTTSVFERCPIGAEMLDGLYVHDVNLTERAGASPSTPLHVYYDITDGAYAARSPFLQPIWVKPPHEHIGIARRSHLLDLLLRDYVGIVAPRKLLASRTGSKHPYC